MAAPAPIPAAPAPAFEAAVDQSKATIAQTVAAAPEPVAAAAPEPESQSQSRAPPASDKSDADLVAEFEENAQCLKSFDVAFSQLRRSLVSCRWPESSLRLFARN